MRANGAGGHVRLAHPFVNLGHLEELINSTPKNIRQMEWTHHVHV